MILDGALPERGIRPFEASYGKMEEKYLPYGIGDFDERIGFRGSVTRDRSVGGRPRRAREDHFDVQIARRVQLFILAAAMPAPLRDSGPSITSIYNFPRDSGSRNGLVPFPADRFFFPFPSFNLPPIRFLAAEQPSARGRLASPYP